MAAGTNPKNKRARAENNAKKTAESSSKTLASSSTGLIESYLGSTLLTGGKDCIPKPTSNVLKGKELVALYFSASWCTPCQKFTPLLTEFYNNCASKTNDLEIVFVSSDKDYDSFQSYFDTMPWTAMCGDTEENIQLKGALATKLKAYRLPALVILNARTGTFMTDQGRKEVEATEGDIEKGKALIASWKEREPTPIGQGSGSSMMDTFLQALEYLSKKPMLVVAMIAVLIFTPTIKRIKDNPVIGVAFVYMFSRLGREDGERNLPYELQVPIKEKNT